MKDFTDGTNRTIILLTFFLFYMYLKYTITQLQLTKPNIGKIKCNPLEMVVGSIFDEEQANKTFSNCMEYSASEKMIKQHQDLESKYNSEITDLVDTLENTGDNNEATSKEQQEKLFELLNKKTSSVNDLVQQQSLINNSISKASQPIQDMVTKIGDILVSFKSALTAYSDNVE